jgi:YD repeat-containing protein
MSAPSPAYGPSVTFNVGYPVVPPAPTNLTATAVSGAITLNWTASLGASTYTVYESTSISGPFAAIQSGITSTTYSVSPVVDGTTYYFYVIAVNSIGSSGPSNIASATAFGSLPAPPTNLVAVPGNSSVALNWSGSLGANTYTVYYSTSSSGTFNLWTSGLTGTACTVSPLSNGTTYFFYVVAVNSTGVSTDSNVASATPSIGGGPPPAPVLSDSWGNNVVNLTWTSSPGAALYTVCRGTTNGGPYPTQFTTTSTAYQDSTALNGTTYYYIVFATDAEGVSPNSNQVIAKPGTVPPAPTNLSAIPGNQSVSLYWTASPGAVSYTVYQSASGSGPFSPIQTNVTATYWPVPGLQNGVTYYFYIEAVNVVGPSLPSNIASATPYGVPAAPTNLSATPGNTYVNLTWTTSPGAVNYAVYDATSASGPFGLVNGNVASTAFQVQNLQNGTTYWFYVVAQNFAGPSPPSNTVSATPVAPPVAPSLAAYPGNLQATLIWNAVPNANSYSYGISTGSAGPFTFTNVATATTVTVGSLQNGTTYYFVVYATGYGGQSPNSNVASATPTAARVPIGIIPNPPTGYLPDALALPEWEDHTVPEDSSDAPGVGPSSVFGISLPFGVVDVSSGVDLVMDDPIMGTIGFGRIYRTALAAGNISSPGLPAGWSHNYDYRMYPQKSNAWGPIQLVYPNGASETLTPVVTGGNGTGNGCTLDARAPRGFQPLGPGGPGGPTGAFTVPANAPYGAMGTPSSTVGVWTTITLTHNGAEAYVFSMDAGDTVYRLHTVVNDAGSQTNVTYSGGKLANITSSSTAAVSNPYSGTKNIAFYYYSSGLLQAVQATGTGAVDYFYTNGELTSVTNINSASILWSYAYQSVNGAPYLVYANTNNTSYGANVAIDPLTGRATTLTDANLRSHTYSYSGLTPTSTSGTSTVNAITGGVSVDQNVSNYDGLGRLTQAKDAAGNATSVSWLGGSLLTATPPSGPGTTVTRDAYGNPTKILYPHGNYTSLTWNYTTTAYPAGYPFGQLAQTQEFGGSASMSPTAYQYYASTNLAAGQLSGYVSKVTYPSGQVVSYTYTGLGQVLAATTLAADGVTSVSTQMTYSLFTNGVISAYEMFGKPYTITDAMGFVTKVNYGSDQYYQIIDPLSNSSSISLNPNRQVIGTTDASNTSVSYTYPVPGEPVQNVSVTGAAGQGGLESLGYDAEYGVTNSAGPGQTTVPSEDPLYNLKALMNGNNQNMYAFSWDPFTMQSSSTVAASSANADAWTSQLDKNGNVTSFTGPSITGTVTRTSDELPTSVNWSTTLPEGAPFANYTYDGFGRQATNEATSGISHAYTYDSAGRLVKDSCYGYTVAYTYAANGARLSMAVTTSQGGSCNYSYTYDKNSRVISIAAICGTNSATVDYTYDNDGHVTEVTTPQANIFYSYDGGGRVTALQNLTPAGVVDDPTTQITGPDQLQHSVFSSFTGLNGPISYDTMWNVQGFQYQARVEPKNYLTGSVAYAFGSAASGSMPYAIESEAWTGSVNTSLDYTRDGGENLIQIRNDTLNKLR